MERGTLFVLLFFGIAPAVALLLLWRGIARARQDAHRRKRVVFLTLTALGLWIMASDFMLEIIFATAWGLAHTRPFPEGFFPEGWPVYGVLAAYSVCGAALVWAVQRDARRK